MSSSEPVGPPAGARSVFALIAPWLVAVLVLAWVIHSVRWSDLVAALARVELVSFVAVSMLLLVAMWLLDAFAMQRTFAIFGLRASLREMVIVRGASYLFAAVQYYAGQAAILGFLYRRGTPFSRAAGWMLFISAINFGILLLLAAAGASGSTLLGAATTTALAAVLLACALYAGLLHFKPRALARWPLLAPLFEAGIAGHVRAVLVRLPHVAALVAWNVYALRAFHVQVPIFAALALVPVVLFANALPVSAQGLGLAQLTAIMLFAGYGGESGRAAVLAASLALTSAAIVVQIAIGLLMLEPSRKLARTTDAAPFHDAR